MMRSASSILIISSIFCLLSLTESHQAHGKLQIHPWFAASCIALSEKCNWFYAKYSGAVCLEKTRSEDQPSECLEMACPWCTEWKKRSLRYPCGDEHVQKACTMKASDEITPVAVSPSPVEPTPSPVAPKPSPVAPKPSPVAPTPAPIAPKPSPEPENNPDEPLDGKCAWTGENDNVVIDLGKVPLTSGWDRTTRDGYKGIIFMRSPSKGISPKGMYGKMCFNVKAAMSGTYYLTAISYAPHNTEHNDVWVDSSKGFELWQRGKMDKYVKPGTWMKAYQNSGLKGMSEHFKTIDFNGHRFLVPGVLEGETFQVCLAGRSKKYEMYRLVLVKCEGMYCQGGIMKGLFDMKPSTCL